MRVRRSLLNRRDLIHGRFGLGDALVTLPHGEIASALVQVRPDKLAEIEAAILRVAGCEIHGRDPKGKLVVVIDVRDAGAVGATLTTLVLLPHVYSASLVFHAVDAAEPAGDLS